MKLEREAGQWLVVPGKEFSPLPQLDDVMLIEHKHGSLWAVHEAYARGYRAGAEAQRERDAKMAENALIPEGFRKTGMYGEFEEGGDDCLRNIAEAIRSAEIPK